MAYTLNVSGGTILITKMTFDKFAPLCVFAEGPLLLCVFILRVVGDVRPCDAGVGVFPVIISQLLFCYYQLFLSCIPGPPVMASGSPIMPPRPPIMPPRPPIIWFGRVSTCWPLMMTVPPVKLAVPS